MRNFRTAAVAAATAVTVAFGGTAIASAATTPDTNSSSSKTNKNPDNIQSGTPAKDSSSIAGEAFEGLSSKEEGTLSSKVGKATEGNIEAAGANLFGKNVDDSMNADWSILWRDTTYALIGTTIIGAIIGAYNYAVYNGILPNHILDPIFRR